jgi:hypothetical protein
MATKIISFDIQCSIDVHQYFEIPEDYPTENKSIEELYDEIWEYYGDDSQVNVLTEEIHPFEFEGGEMDFVKIDSFSIEE